MEREEFFIELAPHLFAENCWLDCGTGWDLLLEDLCSQLEKIIVEGIDKGLWDLDDHPVVLQIKERFGCLRVYMSFETTEMADLISDAESASYHICENCGFPGKLREEKNWYSVHCLECWENKRDKIYALMD